jgi:hypothetical protein
MRAGGAAASWSAPAAAPARPSASARPRVAPVPVTYPARGGAAFTTARAETGPEPTGGGRLLRYRVEVERDIHGLAAGDLAAFVAATLDDPHGWTAGGKWRLRRVGAAQPADFTIYLVTLPARAIRRR